MGEAAVGAPAARSYALVTSAMSPSSARFSASASSFAALVDGADEIGERALERLARLAHLVGSMTGGVSVKSSVAIPAIGSLMCVRTKRPTSEDAFRTASSHPGATSA